MKSYGSGSDAGFGNRARQYRNRSVPEAKEHILEVKNLNIYYGEKRAVNDISMRIDKHAVTALIGPSGCGKSTF